jgi:outer membrane protein assembly factor BamD (BamD/ComL family)
MLGLARIGFMGKNWLEAEKWYDDVIHGYPETMAAPEAMYWRAVANYKRTNDHTVLTKVSQVLEDNYPKSLWNSKAVPWRDH